MTARVTARVTASETSLPGPWELQELLSAAPGGHAACRPIASTSPRVNMKRVFLEKTFLMETVLKIAIRLYFKAYKIVFRLIYTASKAVMSRVAFSAFPWDQEGGWGPWGFPSWRGPAGRKGPRCSAGFSSH